MFCYIDLFHTDFLQKNHANLDKILPRNLHQFPETWRVKNSYFSLENVKILVITKYHTRLPGVITVLYKNILIKENRKLNYNHISEKWQLHKNKKSMGWIQMRAKQIHSSSETEGYFKKKKIFLKEKITIK